MNKKYHPKWKTISNFHSKTNESMKKCIVIYDVTKINWSTLFHLKNYYQIQII